jgi:hypothetical protein
MAGSLTFDFDATGEERVVNFMRDFFDNAVKHQETKNSEFKRVYKLIRNEMDMSNRDPNRSNIMVPKLHSTIETILPVMVDALFGVRPYIPIELTKNENADIGDAQTDLLDRYLDTPQFFSAAVQWLKFMIAYGTSFMEATPDFESKRVETLVPIMSTDLMGNPVPIGMENVVEIKNYLKLRFRAFAPWEIFQDPIARNLDECRGIIKYRGIVSKRELKKMAARGAFPDFDIEKLDDTHADLDKDNWNKRIAEAIGAPVVDKDSDLGVWLSFESNDRYIDMWGFSHILRDIDNPYAVANKGHGKINLTKIINTDDPNPYTSWYGIGEGKSVEQLIHGMNENWNQTFDNHNMINQGVVYYEEDALNVDQLVMIPGNRIPVDIGGTGRSIADVVQERPLQGLTRDHYAIPEKFELMIDQTTGVFDISRGESAVKGSTAREAILRKQSGESRTKLKIKMCEQLGLNDLAMKCIAHIDQFATSDDIVDKIGMEKAQALPTVNPAAIDGGNQFAFKGSSRQADSQIKRQDAKDVYQLMAGNPSVDQNWLANMLLEHFEIPDQERRKAVRTDENAMQIEAQRAALLNQAGGEVGGGAGSSIRAISNGANLGANLINGPSGKDKNEKLGMNI